MSNWPTEFAPKDSGAIDSFEVGELLASLTDKSLVVLDEATGRYRLLETIRDYARILLASVDEVDGMRRRHRDFFLALAEKADSRLTGSEQAEWLERLEREHENLRASLDLSLKEETGKAGLRLCGALQRYWWTRGYLTEGREWSQRVLGKPGEQERTKERAKALNGAGVMASMQADYASARSYFERSLSIGREIGDRRGVAVSLNNLGNVASDQCNYASAQTFFEESLSIHREISNRWGIASSLHSLGCAAHMHGDYVSARAYYEESLSIKREMGDKHGIAGSLTNLGFVANHQGDYASARIYLEESLSIQREIGDQRAIAFSLSGLGDAACYEGDFASARTYLEESLFVRLEIGDRLGVAISLEAFAGLMAGQQLAERAARLWGAAEALRGAIGAPLPSNESEEDDHQIDSVRQTLSEESFSQAWAEGRAMSLEQAIELALGSGEG